MRVNLQISQTELKAMKTEKGSKLLPFKQEIVYIRKEGVPFSGIQAWLAKKGVDSSIENIRQFFERYKHELSDMEFKLKDETIPDDEYYPYDDDQDVSDDMHF
jgi:hypothetical protein